MKQIEKFTFGDVSIDNRNGYKFTKKTPRYLNATGDAYEFASFNPTDIDSVMKAAKYVGADHVELENIKEYFLYLYKNND